MTQILANVRDELNKVLLRMSDTDEGAQSRAVVKEFRKSHSHLITRASKELEDATLVQMVSSLKRRKPPRSIIPMRDLFADLDQVVVVNVQEDGRIVRKNKTPRKLTLPEAEAYLANARKDRERDDEKIERLETMINKARPYILGGGTLEEGLAAADAEAEAKGKRKS